jgi:hypothetical protein
MDRPRSASLVAALACLLLGQATAHAMLSPRRLVPPPPPPPDIPIPAASQPPVPVITQGQDSPNPPPAIQDTPEPATAVTGLIGAGLAGIACWRRRRAKKDEQPEEAIP